MKFPTRWERYHFVDAHARIFGSSFRVNKFLVGESSLVSRNLFIILSLRKYSRVSRTCYIIKL